MAAVNDGPVHRDPVTADVAARLVAAQFRQWAGLPVVPVELNGWDNTTFRLGDELLVRLPSADRYTAQVAKEHHWLPVLAPRLPLPAADRRRERTTSSGEARYPPMTSRPGS